MWINATAFGRAGSARYFAELQPRLGDGVSDLDQLLLRGAIGWQLSPKITAFQGYAYIETPRDNAPAFKEDRAFQQLNLGPFAVGRASVSGRSRLEQRWRADGDDMGWRLRQQVRVAHPLGTGPGPAAVGWAEGFWSLNTTDWGAAKGFDRGRAFAGVELPLTGKSTVETGYMAQIISGAGNSRTLHHVASVSLFLRR